MEQYNRVVVVCDKDILADLIIQYHVITCHRGKWKPKMPGCRGKIGFCTKIYFRKMNKNTNLNILSTLIHGFIVTK